MKIKLSLIILIIFTNPILSELNYITEYHLLWTDLKNAEEIAYKAHCEGQGVSRYVKSVRYSSENTHFLIRNPGFFKILLENGVAYTRSGEFHLFTDEKGYITLRTKQNYLLADPIALYIDIIKGYKGDEEVIDTIVVNNKATIIKQLKSYTGKYDYLTVRVNSEKVAQQLKVYDVPYEQLQHFNDAIYTLKSTMSEITVNPFASVQANFLEESNTEILPVLVRMYYLLSKYENIKNRTFKADLIKIGIQIVEGGKQSDYIKTILPFIQYDY